MVDPHHKIDSVWALVFGPLLKEADVRSFDAPRERDVENRSSPEAKKRERIDVAEEDLI